jgi:hypothetical protein
LEEKQGHRTILHSGLKIRPFGMTVLNGLGNEHALQMTRLASIDPSFNDEYVRAKYQQEMFNGIKPALEKPEHRLYGIRIHDDCLASGDSIVSYLLRMTKEDPDSLKKGVEVIIDGPATAQGILFLRAFAKQHDINLHITASHMAFGLTKGVEEKRGAQHSKLYYLSGRTAEELGTIDPNLKEEIEQYKTGGIIQVVGDMGEAEQGIKKETMELIRMQSDVSCPWNDHREDPQATIRKKQHKLKVPRSSKRKAKKCIFCPRRICAVCF